MGRAVAIHPLAVIIAIATGAVLAGIVGALVAVPTVAVLNTAIRHLAAVRRAEDLGAPLPGPPAPTGPPAPEGVAPYLPGYWARGVVARRVAVCPGGRRLPGVAVCPGPPFAPGSPFARAVYERFLYKPASLPTCGS